MTDEDTYSFPETFSDRMKMYEGREAQHRGLEKLPIMVRLDGKNFSKLTSHLTKPFDSDFSTLMIECAKYLAHEHNANCAYTQSDEITLVFHSEDFRTTPPFGGRFQKICSIMAAQCSLMFNSMLDTYFANLIAKKPVFDCRAWVVPSKEEAANVFLWREYDGTRNSVQMAAHAVFSHNELHGKNTKQQQAMLLNKGINWNDYPVAFKRGTYIQRKQQEDRPDKSIHSIVDMPILSKVANRASVLLDGADPVLIQEDVDVSSTPKEESESSS